MQTSIDLKAFPKLLQLKGSLEAATQDRYRRQHAQRAGEFLPPRRIYPGDFIKSWDFSLLRGSRGQLNDSFLTQLLLLMAPPLELPRVSAEATRSKSLQRKLPFLTAITKLDLEDCYQISAEFLETLLRCCPHLSYLNIKGCSAITRQSATTIGTICQNLTTLIIDQHSTTQLGTAWHTMTGSVKSLTTLVVSAAHIGRTCETDPLENIPHLPILHTLTIHYARNPEGILKKLLDFPKATDQRQSRLRFLDISSSLGTPVIFNHLQPSHSAPPSDLLPRIMAIAMSTLTSLTLIGVSIHPDSFKRLQEMTHLNSITLHPKNILELRHVEEPLLKFVDSRTFDLRCFRVGPRVPFNHKLWDAIANCPKLEILGIPSCSLLLRKQLEVPFDYQCRHTLKKVTLFGCRCKEDGLVGEEFADRKRQGGETFAKGVLESILQTAVLWEGYRLLEVYEVFCTYRHDEEQLKSLVRRCPNIKQVRGDRRCSDDEYVDEDISLGYNSKGVEVIFDDFKTWDEEV
ncbi:hypothetical protein HK097_008835 [Rhizophlyctis rosea]|uniref:Uncharacterized protein n=1 Tax=Rhizophlyctis rosea TaxID=64517 RepID=A0AAD5SBX5_9FUNG|nr:hypothetical protein HK097_008835 [Rhizophlyctis rosea]